MEQKKFEAVLVLLVPQIIHLIAENQNCSEICAAKQFYSSYVYVKKDRRTGGGLNLCRLSADVSGRVGNYIPTYTPFWITIPFGSLVI